MASWVAVPILGGLVILESTLISRFPLLHGTPDLVLLVLVAWSIHPRVQTAWQWSIIAGMVVSLSTALPMGVPLIGYGIVTGMALALRRRVWQVPVLAMFLVTFLGTLVTHGIAVLALELTGRAISLMDAVNLITLPSLLLNLLLALPAYAIIGDLANWLYPDELTV